MGSTTFNENLHINERQIQKLTKKEQEQESIFSVCPF